MSTSVQITFDCADPDSLAHFWADLLGYELDSPPDGYDSWEDWLTEQGVPESEWNSKSAITDPDGDGPRIFFQRVPEQKERKNRVHLDVNAGGPLGTPVDERQRLVDAAVERAVELGASQGSPRRRTRRAVLRDAGSREQRVLPAVAPGQVEARRPGRGTLGSFWPRPRTNPNPNRTGQVLAMPRTKMSANQSATCSALRLPPAFNHRYV